MSGWKYEGSPLYRKEYSMSQLTEKERRIGALEKALQEACGYVESAAETIDDLDPGDIDGENKDARRKVNEWRRLLENGR